MVSLVAATRVVLHSDGWTQAAATLTGVAALATAALAVLTSRMAKATKNVAEKTQLEAEAVTQQVSIANRQVEVATKQVSVASEQVELTRTAMRASIRPWLAPALRRIEAVNQEDGDSYHERRGVIELDEDGGYIFGGVPVRNIGPGVAIIDRRRSEVLGHTGINSELSPFANLRSDLPALPSREEAWLAFTIPKMSTSWSELTIDTFVGYGHDDSFALDVWCTDWSEEQPTRTRFHIGRVSADSEWHIMRSEYFDGESGELTTRAEALPWNRE